MAQVTTTRRAGGIRRRWQQLRNLGRSGPTQFVDTLTPSQQFGDHQPGRGFAEGADLVVIR